MESKRKHGTTKSKINLRLLVSTIVVLALLGGGIFAWHQQARTAMSNALFTEASRILSEQQDLAPSQERETLLTDAINQLEKFLALNPDDSDARILLANAFDMSAASIMYPERNILLQLDALAVSSGETRSDLLLRVTSLLNRARRFSEARESGEELVLERLEERENDLEFAARAYRQLALALTGLVFAADDPSLVVKTTVGDSAVGEVIEQAIEMNPDDFVLPCFLAGMYRETNMHPFLSERQRQVIESATNPEIEVPAFADQIVADMLDRNRILARAWLASHRYKLHYQLDSAEADLVQASKVNPEDTEINFLYGCWLIDSGVESNEKESLEQATRYLQKTIEQDDGMIAGYSKLGEAFARLGQSEKAREAWLAGLKRSGREELILFQQLTAELLRSGTAEDRAEADELLAEMDGLVDQIARRAESDPKEVKRWKNTHDFLLALSHYYDRKYGDSLEILDRITQPPFDDDDEVIESAVQLLSQIHFEFGRPEEAAARLDAVNAKTDDRRKLLQVAEAYLASENYDRAIAIYRRYATATRNANAWLKLGHALFLKQLQLPPKLQQWNEFDRVISQARAANAQPAWQSEYLQTLAGIERIAQFNRESVMPYLDRLVKIADQSPEVSRQLAIQFNRLQDYGQCDHWYQQHLDLLKKEESALSGSSQSAQDKAAIFHAGLLCERDAHDQALVELKKATDEIDDFARKQELMLAQIHVLLDQGKFDRALAELRRMVKANPKSGRLLFEMAELTIRLNRIQPHRETWERELEKFETENGRYHKFFAAYRSLKLAEQATDLKIRENRLNEADSLRMSIAEYANRWPLLNILTGDIYFQKYLFEQKVNPNGSVAELIERTKSNYRQAVLMGERDPRILQRLALIDAGSQEGFRWAELIDTSAPRSELGMQARVVDPEARIEEARRYARMSTDMSPVEPAAWVYRAFVEWSTGNHQTAEEHAEQALKLLGANPSIDKWRALFNFRVNAMGTSKSPQQRKHHLAKARELMPRIVELSEEGLRTATHATLLAAVEDRKAAELFLVAVQQSPKNPVVLAAASEYFSMTGTGIPDSLDQAIRITEALFQLRPNVPEVEEHLATLLARRGLESDWKRLAELQVKTDQSRGLDPRSYAILLLHRVNVSNSERQANLNQALQVLDGFLENSEPRAADRMLQAQLYRRLADVQRDESTRQANLQLAEKCFEQALEFPELSPEHLYVVGGFLVEQGQLERAQSVASKLEERIEKLGVLSALALTLKAKILAAGEEDHAEQIASMIGSFAREIETDIRVVDAQRTNWYVMFGKICDEVELHQEAVRWYQQAAEKNLDLVLELSQSLTSNGDFEAAVNSLVTNYPTAIQSSKPYFVVAIADALINGQIAGTDDLDQLYQSAQPALAQAEQDFPENLRVLVSLANIRLLLGGEPESAKELYLKARGLAPKNEMVLNNLATILCDELGEIETAEQVIDEALQLAPNNPKLLDTKAVILRHQSQLDRAAEILNNIVSPNGDSRFWWHLAEVEWDRFANQETESLSQAAQRHLQQAIDNGLEMAVLTPNEKTRLLKFKEELSAAGFTSTANRGNLNENRENLVQQMNRTP